MSARLARQLELQFGAGDAGGAAAAATAPDAGGFAVRGRQCPECGARALRRADGCDRCSQCHYVGSCG
jgi:ribonucleoside-diphosphate reductase alpha chain